MALAVGSIGRQLMRTWIATWPRRLGVAAVTFVGACVAGAFWLRHPASAGEPLGPPLADAVLIKVLLAVPVLLALCVLALTTWLASPSPEVASASGPTPPPPGSPAPRFKAQVVGVHWMNPLVRLDYPTEWQLLWVQGLARPNKGDDMVREDPKKYSTVQPIANIGSALDGRALYSLYFEGYLQTFLQPIGRRYATDGSYFYTIQPDSPRNWRELHGIHIQLGIAADERLSAAQAAAFVRGRMNAEFVFNDTELSTGNIPADVHVSQGGANVGFDSLDAAMDYLQAHPDKSAWVMNWDSPAFPDDESMSENCTLLVLAGPDMKTRREPLAWIARPARTHAKDFQTREGAGKVGQAWEAALRQATLQADTTPGRLAHVIHDIGVGSPASRRSPGPLQALATMNPELHPLEDTFNTPQLLGEMRAGSAVTDLALAVAWTHQKGAPVLVAGTTEPDDPVAVVVLPPAHPRVADPDKPWFRARGEGNAFLPWWGLRKDRDGSQYMQGYSD